MYTQKINITLILDENYILPAAATIQSIKTNKKNDTQIAFFIITPHAAQETCSILKKLEGEDFSITLIPASLKQCLSSNCKADTSFYAANKCSLLKFELPQLLPNIDKVLYLDCDVFVQKDLSDLYHTDISDYAAAAVASSETLYSRSQYTQNFEHCFNTGVMLLNLKWMREHNSTEELYAAKESQQNFSLMEQNLFNVLFDGHVKLLPIRYNFECTKLFSELGKWTYNALNELYGTRYSAFSDILEDAAVIHFSAEQKPWKYAGLPGAARWEVAFRQAWDILHPVEDTPEMESTRRMPAPAEKGNVKVSVIIPVFNTEKYLPQALDSILNQTLQDIEVICVDDGSTDASPEILRRYSEKDSRLTILTQKNSGVSCARNKGLDHAHGRYVYFMDSDDMLLKNALEALYARAEKDNLDMVLFEASIIYENETLKAQFAKSESYYRTRGTYEGVWDGKHLFCAQVKNHDYRVCPVLRILNRQFLIQNNHRFVEGLFFEDNLYTLQVTLTARRIACIKEPFYIRRFRIGSIMTQPVTPEVFRNNFHITILMLRYMLENNFGPEVSYFIKVRLRIRCKITHSCMAALAVSERRMPFFPDSRDAILADLLFPQIAGDAASVTRAQSELERIKNSYAYRVSRRFADMIPRKLKTIIKKLIQLKLISKQERKEKKK